MLSDKAARIVLRTVATDVVVLSVVAVPRLHLEHLWVAFGTGQYFKYIPAREIAGSIRPERATALPVFYAYMECDIVSSFAIRGKKLAVYCYICQCGGDCKT